MHNSPAQTTTIDPRSDSMQRTALLLDFDGTLVDITRTPDAVTIGRELVEVMSGVCERLGGRVESSAAGRWRSSRLSGPDRCPTW